MTDQPKPDKKPEPDVSNSTVPPKVDPAQAKSEAAPPAPPADPVVNKQSDAPPANGDAAKASVGAVSDSPAKPVSNDAPKPAATGTSDPTRPSKEGLSSTVNLNEPRFKDLVVSSPTAGEVVPGKKEEMPLTAPLAEEKPPEAKPAEPKVTQRIPDAASLGIASSPAASSSSAATICPTCGHRNRPGILLCENCGTNLMTGGRASIGTRDLKREEEAKAEANEKLLDTNERKAVDTAGGTIFTEDMVLRIEIEGGSTPMLVYPKQEIIMGRRDPNTGGMPDVDLTAYAGYRMGVSRRHAAMRLQENHLHVSDLGSSNGTFLNGTRLNAHRPYQLRDGDEVRLGQMVLRVFFQTNKERK